MNGVPAVGAVAALLEENTCRSGSQFLSLCLIQIS